MENAATMNIKYDEEYFDEELKKANEEKAFEKGKVFEKVLGKVQDSVLFNLFTMEGKDFYKELLTILGSLRFYYPKDKAIQKGIDEIKQATGLDGEELDEYLRGKGIDPKEYGISGEHTTKLAIGNILGFLKVVWDTSVIGLGLFTRVSVKLVGNIGKAFFDTMKYAKDEGIASGHAIKDSWDRNMK